MALRDYFQSDLDIFFDEDEFAETGNYTSKEAGTTIAVRVLIDYAQEPGQDIANTNSSQAKAHLIKSELPAPARYGDLLEIDGAEWQVVRQAGGDSLVVVVELRRDVRDRYKR